MSVPVTLAELPGQIERFGNTPYLVTVGTERPAARDIGGHRVAGPHAHDRRHTAANAREMPDLLDRIRAEMNTRLAELRPLVDEERRLDAALQALGNATNDAPAVSVSLAAPVSGGGLTSAGVDRGSRA